MQVHIQGVSAQALIDTGSAVSTISLKFYETYLHDILLQPVECLLTLECADGTELPYHGVISCELQVYGIADSPQTIQCLFLIVNDTKYHESVPTLIGTNILSVLLSETKQKYGVQFLQKVKVHTPWFIAFRCMTLRERGLSRRAYVLARVKSAEERPVTIPPNSSVTIQGYLFDKLPYRYYPVCGTLSPTARSRIPTDLDIEPSVITYDTAGSAPIPVHVSNITTNTVTINPRALLCEVQQISIQNFPRKTSYQKHLMYSLRLIYLEMSFLRNNCKKFMDYLTALTHCFPKETQISDIAHMLNTGLSSVMSLHLNNVSGAFHRLC